jgi:hypothetical protein
LPGLVEIYIRKQKNRIIATFEISGGKMKRTALLTACLVTFLFACPAYGFYTVSFEDTVITFPGWENGTEDDLRDVIGLPDILGGQLTYDSNYNLVSIQFSYIVTQNQHLWNRLTPGDLFIDLGSDGTWDYTVGTFGAEDFSNVAVNSVSVPLGGPGYVMSGADGMWSGYNIRDDHPIAVDGGTPYSTAAFTGWRLPGSPEDVVWVSYIFDPASAINVRDGLIIGWTLNCANDVIYQKIDIPIIDVPEPATLLLLCFGIAGLTAFRRKARN